MIFKPAGERARWRIVYDVLTSADIGDVVTYEQLGDELFLDPNSKRNAIQMAIRRAAAEYEKEDHRALEAVPNIGYRVIYPEDHLRVARGHQKKANHSLERGHSKVVNVDISHLDPELRHTFEIVARAFSVQLDFNRRFTVRQDRIEQAMSGLEKRSERSSEELVDLRARLEELERSH